MHLVTRYCFASIHLGSERVFSCCVVVVLSCPSLALIIIMLSLTTHKKRSRKKEHSVQLLLSRGLYPSGHLKTARFVNAGLHAADYCY